MTNKNTTIKYVARLKREITRTPYFVKTIYKSGTVICEFTEKQFVKLTSKNIYRYNSLSICEGHGVYEYFDLETDIEFVKITTTTTTNKKEVLVKLKK
jgi:hypothetical protein